MRPLVPWLCLAALFGASLGSVGCDKPGASVPRNLLLITLDTLRADHLGAYGYERPTSPAFDAFAAGASLFEDVTCSMPTTLPSHASIFTGLRPSQHGLRRNGEIPTRDLTTFFDLLKSRGAATAGVVGSRVLGPEVLVDMGLDAVDFPGSERQYQVRARQVSERAIAWLDEQGDAPFALWLHYFDTHEPYTPPQRLAQKFDRGYSGSLPDRLDTPTLVGFNDPAVAGALTGADLAHITDLYDAEIAYLDHELGRLLKHLQRSGALDDTLVVIVGDHGQALGENAFFGHGLRLLEPVIKVPLIVRLPGQDEGRRISTPVETIDLVPMLAELFELEAPPGLEGRSLAPALRGERLDTPRWRVVERRAYPARPEVVGVALHGGDWKAIYYRDLDGSELRHLGRHPAALDGANHYHAGAPEADWLETAWRDVAAASRVPGVDLDGDHRRVLRALGYLD